MDLLEQKYSFSDIVVGDNTSRNSVAVCSAIESIYTMTDIELLEYYMILPDTYRQYLKSQHDNQSVIASLWRGNSYSSIDDDDNSGDESLDVYTSHKYILRHNICVPVSRLYNHRINTSQYFIIPAGFRTDGATLAYDGVGTEDWLLHDFLYYAGEKLSVPLYTPVTTTETVRDPNGRNSPYERDTTSMVRVTSMTVSRADSDSVFRHSWWSYHRYLATRMFGSCFF